eukprot:TRINITY_DN1875_c0_g2_i2.p1 TRINITY_DN1875_c0_g2~~TRINITY_DN1875_c0_g2_i2.p1  ORF type:complete len:403 (+),score=32.38 TRINITY_DN1875_c0_g2_i2:42-1211(+)
MALSTTGQPSPVSESGRKDVRPETVGLITMKQTLATGPPILVPRPLSEAEVIESTAPTIQNQAAHRLACFIVHSMRCYGHVPGLMVLFRYKPKLVMKAVALYAALRQTDVFNTAVHWAIQYGSSRQPRFIKARREPYDTNKQYLISHHPHGLLICSWFNWLGREEVPSATNPFDNGFSSGLKALDGLLVNLCVAPAVQYMTLHGEMYRDKVTDAQAKTVKGILRRTRNSQVKESVCICPGGFSEAVYTGYSDKYEVAYLDGRAGFLRIAIEEGVDVIPTYTFGAADMYKSVDWRRHQRAMLSQRTNLPFMLWYGKYGTNMPYFEDTVTVAFDPFPTSQYKLEDLSRAHADYCEYLRTCFDAYKGCCSASRDKEFMIIGNKNPPHSHARL